MGRLGKNVDPIEPKRTRLARCGSGVLRSESGQSLVELALLTPFLLLMALGVIEIGRYAFISIVVGNAARAGAAYGAQGSAQAGDAAGIQNAAQNDFSSNGLSNAPTIASSNACWCDNAGALSSPVGGTGAGNCGSVDPRTACPSGQHWVVTLAVTATGTYKAMFKYPAIPSSISLTKTCTMRVAQD